MQSKFLNSSPEFPLISQHRHQAFRKIVSCAKNSSSSENKNGLKKFGKYLGDYKTKLNELDGRLVQEKINIWVSKTTNFVNELTSPLVQEKNATIGNSNEIDEMEELFIADHTIDITTPTGNLSFAAVISIEQFSRMNGLTGKKMQMMFKALVPENVSNNARNLVEYCCFKFLSRDNSQIHPCLKDPAFQRLIFITMLAWEHPYSNGKDSSAEKVSFQNKLVEENAFIRLAPAVCGLADIPTVHNLFKALSGPQKGISFRVFSTYITELLKVYEGRKSYDFEESPHMYGERILCLGSSRKRPVLKWENNMAWPGKLTLTDKALYFEEIGLRGRRDAIRLDLTGTVSRVEKARVGPLGSDLFDSAVSVTSGPDSESWTLEFVDFGGEMRRDVWHALIKEVISVHKFIQDFGPKENDPLINNIYGAKKGKIRATNCAISGITRLQALQSIKKLIDEPTKLVQFSYLQNAPYGDIVRQTLAVNLWGGPLTTRVKEVNSVPSGEVSNVYNNHVYDIDGSVYLRRWMRDISWSSNNSVIFWKNNSVKRELVLSKNHVVRDKNLVEKAVVTCRDKYQVVESTQATIDAAMIEGIPSNIDLFKELLLPLTMLAKNFEKLRHWEEPHLTASFLAFTYALIFRNLLCYVFPTALMMSATLMLVIKGLKEQGRLGRSFGKVTIHDQPPSNTIEKIIAVKEAMRDLEKYMQTINVSLLKIRTILLAGQPQITTEVAMVLLFGSAVLLIIPFKYIISFFIFDLFTRELEFRKETVKKFMKLLKERWETVPATPVSVLPFKSSSDNDVVTNQKKEKNKLLNLERTKRKQ